MLAWVVTGYLLVSPACFGETPDRELPARIVLTESELTRRWTDTIQPLVSQYCLDCHSGADAEAKFDMASAKTLEDVLRDHGHWATILHRVEALEMPPKDASPQPTSEERKSLIEWIAAARRFGASRNAGDPGLVATRRLSNAEYNYTIRDLTGQDLQPTKEFPVDPANEAGFDNSSESLTISPALLQKYLAAARHVSEHLVFKPSGIEFAPHPVVTDTDRDKYCVKRIVEFYQRQPTDYADYFFAAWLYAQRHATDTEYASIASTATKHALSVKYLQTVWDLLQLKNDAPGPLAEIQNRWRELPNDPESMDAAKSQCRKMSDYVLRCRKLLEPTIENLDIEGSNRGSQPFVLWKNDQYASYRRRYSESAIEAAANKLPELTVPEDEVKAVAFHKSLARFCNVFPDAFYISERGRDYVGKAKDQQEKGRLLSAGFHSMMGYYRDDQPLCDLVLDASEQATLDRLWQELDYVTQAPHRQYSGFVWFERTDSRFMRDPEFDFARAEDKQVTDADMIAKLAERYVAKAKKQKGSETAVEAVANYFERINAQIRRVEEGRPGAEPTHLVALIELAERAYRRPLTEADRKELTTYYEQLRTEDGLGHEEAIQDTLVSILMSPWFCFHTEHITSGPEIKPLTDIELANRLSYFLWSSMPDQELMRVATNGQLHEPDQLAAQTMRMLQDPKARALAVEFAGNWLDFRRFEEHNSVDRNRFPTFTDELRQAMYEEPIRFFMDVVQRDRGLSDFLGANYTFVNRELAKHYGIEGLEFADEEWKRVDDMQPYHRGGLLPMAVFQTKNAPGLRTSPVKRGYWVVRRLLGERIPAPPPNVPDLPADEKQLGELTLAEVLAHHREHASCAGCHDRFDSIGLVFENFGPIGEWRTEDSGGHAVDSHAVFPDGSEGAGVGGLQRYLVAQRQAEFVNNLSEKLLSYALGRTLTLTDEPLLESIREQPADQEMRFSRLVLRIVTSRQFLNKRS